MHRVLHCVRNVVLLRVGLGEREAHLIVFVGCLFKLFNGLCEVYGSVVLVGRSSRQVVEGEAQLCIVCLRQKRVLEKFRGIRVPGVHLDLLVLRPFQIFFAIQSRQSQSLL